MLFRDKSAAPHKEQLSLELAARGDLFFRSFEVDTRKLDEEARTMELSFSSELPVTRWFGAEYLLHGEKNVNLTRLRSVGSLLYGHRPEDMKNILGPLYKVWLDETDRRAYAKVGFDEDESGAIALAKVKNKSLRGVSIDYMINKAQRIQEGGEWTDPDSKKTFKGPALVATKWTPYGITLTPIPADHTVGVGRDATRSLDGIEIQSLTLVKEKDDMKPEEIQAMIDTSLSALEIPKAEDIVNQLREVLNQEQTPVFKVSATDFSEIVGRAAAISPEAQKRAYEMLLEGKDAEAMKNELLAMVGAPDATNTTKAGDINGTVTTGEKGDTPKTKVDEVDDGEFTRMFTSASSLPAFNFKTG